MRALVVRENSGGIFTKSIEEKEMDALPVNEVLVKVHYAGLNYKDALSASGHKGITRKYPHTPGVDASGEVVHDKTGRYMPGERVICTSYDLGMNTDGGFAEFISVPGKWLVPLPGSITFEESMAMGTAAYTAALALHKMEKCGQHPEMGEVLVTGASGGVGSMALAILKSAGYKAVAASGKTEHYTKLLEFGASRCISRDEVNDTSGKPLLASRWAGAIDNVGGNTLATLIKACAKEGNVASIGLVDSPVLNSSVYPFIMNGVNLLGIDSAETNLDLRKQIWTKLAGPWRPAVLDKMKTIVSLDEIPSYMDKMLRGETLGRIVAKIV
jgi:acrylyl-CoA reductase (NADPH)